MRQLRRFHTYFGVFFAPLLIFFIGSGWYQLIDRDRLKDPGEAETLVQKMRVIHTDQIYPKLGARKQGSPTAFRVLTMVMSGAILITTVLGIVLAIRGLRPRWLVWVMLGLGLFLPILLLVVAPRS